MPEIKVVNGNIEDALRKLKREKTLETIYFKKYVKENVTKSLV